MHGQVHDMQNALDRYNGVGGGGGGGEGKDGGGRGGGGGGGVGGGVGKDGGGGGKGGVGDGAALLSALLKVLPIWGPEGRCIVYVCIGHLSVSCM
jgi:hypothetical protein